MKLEDQEEVHQESQVESDAYEEEEAPTKTTLSSRFLNRVQSLGFIKTASEWAEYEEKKAWIGSNKILSSFNLYTGIKPGVSASVIAVAILGCFLRLSKKNPLLLSQILGVSYPAVKSMLAIERPQANDDERWLTYCNVRVRIYTRELFWNIHCPRSRTLVLSTHSQNILLAQAFDLVLALSERIFTFV